MKVAIIGAGKMGRWFTKYLHNEGIKVVVSNRTKSKAEALKAELGVDIAQSNMDAIRGADWILLCVSLDSLDTVLKEISPYIRSDQAVIDISSIKEIPVNLLHKYVQHGVTLGTHPVFGPGAKSLQGQNFVLTPVYKKEKQFADEFRKWLEKRGSIVTVLSPRKHDVLMSLVLGLPHFVGLVTGETLVNTLGFVEAKMVGGASYKMLLTLAEAVSSEEPVFYSNLHMSLPEMEKIEGLFLEKVEEWLKLVKSKDCSGFSSKMEKLKRELKQLDPEYEKAYLNMYNVLDD